jgi:hypothetical protein
MYACAKDQITTISTLVSLGADKTVSAAICFVVFFFFFLKKKIILWLNKINFSQIKNARGRDAKAMCSNNGALALGGKKEFASFTKY